jgi:hypothetical protein
MIGGIILPIGMFILGWGGNYNSVHWVSEASVLVSIAS